MLRTKTEEAAAILQSKKSEKLNIVVAKPFFEDSDEFIRKWSAPMILGPFMPAVLSMLFIITGQVVLTSKSVLGSCNYPLPGEFNHFRQYLIVYLSVFLKKWFDYVVASVLSASIGFFVLVLVFVLPAFISAVVALCYLFLIVYSWIFIGEINCVKNIAADLETEHKQLCAVSSRPHWSPKLSPPNESPPISPPQ